MGPGDVRRWLEAHRRAAERAAAEARARPDARERSIRGGLALVALAGRRGWPAPEDPHDREQDLDAWRRWARLRAAAGR